MVDIEILGNYELYDIEKGDILYERSNRKFWIRDQIVIKGSAKNRFISNKINEIWLAQLSNHAHKVVEEYEGPHVRISGSPTALNSAKASIGTEAYLPGPDASSGIAIGKEQ